MRLIHECVFQFAKKNKKKLKSIFEQKSISTKVGLNFKSNLTKGLFFDLKESGWEAPEVTRKNEDSNSAATTGALEIQTWRKIMAKKHVNPEFEPPYPKTTKQTVVAYKPLISTL